MLKYSLRPNGRLTTLGAEGVFCLMFYLQKSIKAARPPFGGRDASASDAHARFGRRASPLARLGGLILIRTASQTSGRPPVKAANDHFSPSIKTTQILFGRNASFCQRGSNGLRPPTLLTYTQSLRAFLTPIELHSAPVGIQNHGSICTLPVLSRYQFAHRPAGSCLVKSAPPKRWPVIISASFTLRATSALEEATIKPELGALNLFEDLTSMQKHCLQKLINLCMKDGKKNKSYKIISKTLWRLALSEGAPASFFLLMNAIENVKPIIEVKRVRISGTTQLVPSIIPKNRQTCLAIRWIIEAALARRIIKKSLSLDQCLFAELIEAAKKTGTARKRRDDLHRLAESNRGFAHYRWW